VTIDELEARLARIEARLEMLETLEARALSDTEPPPVDDDNGIGLALEHHFTAPLRDL
jgi:hypothetical protein